ncbi:MAG: hybrid sensor histidine kinase/response regulator, partial [Chloroflexi bacterium]
LPAGNGDGASVQRTLTGAEEKAIVAPLSLYGEIPLGALEIEAAVDELQDEDTRAIIEAVAEQVAQAIEAARLFEQTQLAREEAEALYRVGRMLARAESEEEMFHIILRETLSVLKLQQGGVLMIEPDGKYGVLRALFREGQPVQAGQRIPIAGNPSYAKLIETRQPVPIDDFATDPLVEPVRNLDLGWKIASLLLVPIVIEGKVVGAVGADAVEHIHRFTEREINLVTAMADQLALNLQNRFLLEETRLRAKQLEETAERLKEVDRLKTQFLANMSHELRTPLNSIIGFSRVILKGIDGPLTELQKTDLTSIYNSGQHLLSLINNILDISKIEAGKMELHFERVDLLPLIKSAMSTAVALVKDKPVQLEQDLPDDLPQVWADATRMRQVILNLVSNACKFTDEGYIRVTARADKEKVIVSVSDTGIGIPPEKLDDIFEEFTQVDASTTRKVGGTGLGLPICRHFVEMHGGKIWVESTPGEGSTFTFAIPINPPEQEQTAEPDQASASNGRGRGTVVVVDPDTGLVEQYRQYLSKRGYQVVGITQMTDTGDVMTQVKAYNPVAIILEPILPKLDGWNVLKELKQDVLTKDTPVLLCSVSSDRNRSMSLGAADHLTKPILESELVNTLNHILTQEEKQTRVLVIDDHADDILLIRRMLEAQNYAVSEATSGKEGLALAQKRPPHLIILDLTMPEMDGFAVLDALQADESTRHIPIMIVSARTLTHAETELLRDRVQAVLRKSTFSEEELLEAVRQSLGKQEQIEY